jgi:hypothetical protein
MCVLAYLGFACCFLSVIPAYVLLFFIAFTWPLTFFDGVLWGGAVYSIQLLPVFLSLYYIAGKTSLVFGWLILALYFAVQSGYWFFLLGLARVFFTGIFSRIIAFSSLTTLYFWWLDTGALFVFDYWEGCCLFNPLIPLVQAPQLLYMLPFVGITGMVLLFFLTVVICAAGIIARPWGVFILLGALCGWWLIGFFMPTWQINRPIRPVWLDTIGVVQTNFFPCEKVYPEMAIFELCDQIALLYKAKPNCRLIITPESAVPCYINRYLDACGRLCKVIGSAHLLLGAYRYDEAGVYNCCYWFQQSGIAGCVGKQRGVPFIERIPRLFDYAWLRGWFLEGTDTFVSSGEPQHFIIDNHIIQPVICSDLFFNANCFKAKTLNNQNNQIKKQKIIFFALVNDSWFVGDYLANCLWSVAWLRASAAGAQLLYCSYRKSRFIDRYAEVWNL